MEQVEFVASPDKDYGAEARLDASGSFSVTVTEGTARILGVIFLRMMADPRLLPDVGDAKLETVRPASMFDYETNFDTLILNGGVDQQGLEIIRPSCPTRNAHAITLIITALDALVAHELVHVMHGHLGYKAAAELGKVDDLTPQKERGLEFDADNIAALHVVESYTTDHPLQPTTAFLGGLRPRTVTHEAALRDIALAITVTFLIDREQLRNPRPFATHASPRVRIRMMLANIHRLVVSKGTAIDVATRALNEGIAIAEAGYMIATGRREELDLKLADADKSELRDSQDGWAAIRNDLLPFAFTSLAPPRPEQGAATSTPIW
jgi:hypothetical protein